MEKGFEGLEIESPAPEKGVNLLEKDFTPPEMRVEGQEIEVIESAKEVRVAENEIEAIAETSIYHGTILLMRRYAHSDCSSFTLLKPQNPEAVEERMKDRNLAAFYQHPL